MDNEMMKTVVMTAMEAARVDEGYITSEAEHNIRVCEAGYNIGALQDLAKDENLDKQFTNDSTIIGKLYGIFTWYNQQKAEGKILPDGAIFPGYNPETHTKLKADDSENCQEYRECYVKMLIERAALKIHKQFSSQPLPNTAEAMKPETATAIADLVSAAREVTIHYDAVDTMKPATAAEFAKLASAAQKLINHSSAQA